ncbi:MAG: hypothetical protein K0Q79_633 [Flavipsychrobacter sp.]|nr:hypothetical protein [Flavipsychrobacter sp.]
MSTTLVLFSCQKVVKVDLNSAAPKVVIEANISDEPGPYTVNVSRSVNFDQTNIFPGVAGATVMLSDDAGNTETLTELSPGVYKTTVLTGTPGRTYTLSVTTGGVTYTAISKMNGPVVIDSINAQKGFFSNRRLMHVYFTDPDTVKNWYKIIETVNDSVQRDIFITSDILREGQQLEEILFTEAEPEDSLTKGDSVTIALQSIDEGVYEYFRMLVPITEGSDPGSTPANPKSNFNNGALGYFNAYSVKRKGLILK